jgi:hypothetical protein
MDRKFYIAGAVFLLALLGLGWWIIQPDPLEKFRREVQEWVDTVNQGDYSTVPDHFSTGFTREIESSYGKAPAMVTLLARMDRMDQRSYRLAEISLFEPGHYAEVVFERSQPRGNFNGKDLFTVPFLVEDGDWKVAAGFKDGKSWSLKPLTSGFSY